MKDENKNIERMAAAYRELMEGLGEDLSRSGLENTPNRAAKALSFIAGGYNQNVEEIVNEALFDSKTDDMVIVKDIELYSLCEHHMLPFTGKCHVGYLPRGKVLGLSKVARIVDVFARRLQIQENLTRQIGETIMKYTDALGVGVVVEAQHLCMMMRGVSKQNSIMKTSCMLGDFRSCTDTRMEFLSLIEK